MDASLGEELLASLRELGLPNDHVEVTSAISRSKIRNRLMEEEADSSLKRITNGSFWDISAKYRFDILALDISIIASMLAFSIALSHIYLPFSPRPDVQPLSTTIGSELFWYHLDTGFRLASSGWDRIALLIDLAFDLELSERAKLRTVLLELPRKHGDLVRNRYFKRLKTFRDTHFLDLDGSPPELGIRHETTHRLSLSTRFISEFLEQFGEDPNGQLRNPKELHDMLLVHYHYYLEGINQTISLMESA